MRKRFVWLVLIIVGILEFINIINLFPINRYGTLVVDFDNVIGAGLALFAALQLAKNGGRIS